MPSFNEIAAMVFSFFSSSQKGNVQVDLDFLVPIGTSSCSQGIYPLEFENLNPQSPGWGDIDSMR
ncbi:MAG: hypothetical protein COA78_08250 [Blastopirellula sp.]|nr:MAG: hypothetical protein COA78_08250 [Blastopirellula sp.]